ncbi:MAG: CCA tRNA nucleotidyltransferase [Phycisphaerales bacterium]
MNAPPALPRPPGDAREAAVRIVRTLQSMGHVAYFAGGCVRDELLGLAPEDYDVATDATPEIVERTFRKTKPVGKSFGVVLVRDGRIVTEVATFREEGAYSDKRRPDAVRFADASADAHRRDFTINALFLDPLDAIERPGGRVIDFVGGLGDLERGVVRAVGDPAERLAEDHLRALRAVRFAARFAMPIEEHTGDAIRAHASELEGVSRERIGDELRRILAHPNRAGGARLMQALALDAPALHDGARPDAALDALERLPAGADAPLALAAWTVDRLHHDGRAVTTDDVPETVGRLRRALVLANDECERLRDVLAGVPALRDGWDGAAVAQRKRWGGSGWCDGALGVLGARLSDLEARIRADLDTLANTPGGLAPMPIITGDDLIGAGYEPGPMFGVWLDRVYDAQLEGRIRTREEALSLLGGWANPGQNPAE